jgi:sporulation protein YlmC with PRC-barrel domain
MKKQLVLSLAAAALVAACSTPDHQPSYRAEAANPTYASGPGPIDYNRGMWGTQPLRPPSGLMISTQSSVVGRTFYDANGASVGTVTAVIEDPSYSLRYIVVSSSNFADDLVIPYTAITATDSGVTCNTTLTMLMQLPRYSYVSLEQTYPVATAAVVPVAPPPAPIPPVAAVMPLRLAYAGSIVGYTVTDSAGAPLGRVEAVAVEPASGQVRYAIIANPSFGLGSYIEVPAGDARTVGSSVIVSGADADWVRAPRYTSDQLRLQFSAP